MSNGMRTPGRASRSRAATTIQASRRGRRRRLSSVLPRRRPGSSPRTPFVLLVMALLGTGLVGTLWLSTSAASDSYELSDLHADVASLTEDTELLRQQVAELESPGTLADKAVELGMIPVEDPARLLVLPDGTIELVGEPMPAESGDATESDEGQSDLEQQAGLVPPAGGEAAGRPTDETDRAAGEPEDAPEPSPEQPDDTGTAADRETSAQAGSTDAAALPGAP